MIKKDLNGLYWQILPKQSPKRLTTMIIQTNLILQIGCKPKTKDVLLSYIENSENRYLMYNNTLLSCDYLRAMNPKMMQQVTENITNFELVL